MPTISLINLPREIIYLIFKYLYKEHIVYSFFELNNYFSLIVKYFIGKQFDLTKTNNNIIFQYCLSTVLPSIGSNLHYLSIGHPYSLSTYTKSIKIHCPYLKILNIYCYSEKDDIRYYVAQLIHSQLLSLTLILDNNIVGESISLRLLNKSTDEQFQNVSIASSLKLHLSSINDLILLKQYSESDYLSNGLYMIECISTGEWLIDSKNDICTSSKRLHREHIFVLKQYDNDQCCLEYELYNEQTQCRLTVLICYDEEEHWLPSSILSTHRKESSRSCSKFTFEKINNQNHFYIRPCYSYAKRLQVSGKRIIVSLCDKDNTLNYRFKLHRIQ
ncbi:unnamed protein product [Adineta steineri]|uniref:F-box domain-containing protein n=1 Tax=Adineta steineri TaxID=433720 RepID=A0A818Q5I8_9BILA|nr:unnamed protein product [Adineta steineri]CAF3629562.1 unnamed protein product [Adineta steineri]